VFTVECFCKQISNRMLPEKPEPVYFAQVACRLSWTDRRSTPSNVIARHAWMLQHVMCRAGLYLEAQELRLLPHLGGLYRLILMPQALYQLQQRIPLTLNYFSCNAHHIITQCQLLAILLGAEHSLLLHCHLPFETCLHPFQRRPTSK